MSVGGAKQLFWANGLPYKPLFAVKSDGNAWCFAPTKINDAVEFEFNAKLRISSFQSDYNLFGCNPYLIGTYSWSSTNKVAINNIKTSSDFYWLTVEQMKDNLHDLKVKRVWNAAKTYMKYSCWLDGQFQLEGIDISDNAASKHTGSMYWFAIFAETNVTSGGAMRPSKCPTGVDIQSINLKTDAGMQFDIRACLDKSNEPCFYDIVTKSYIYSRGTGAFIRVDA